MKVVFCAYRDWAFRIFEGIRDLPHEFLLVKSRAELDYEKCRKFGAELFLFYGWSWIVGSEFLKLAPCVCLHPSPLPRYRGGSPLQNQIVRGERESAVTLFYMTEEVDAGDIILQEPLSLDGHLQEILDRITEIGIGLTRRLLSENIRPVPQDHSQATFYRRRKPEESELTIEDFKNKSAQELFDFIRMLEDPYPNAFLRCRDGRRLLFKRVEMTEE